MLFYGVRSLSRGFRLLVESFQQSDSLPFADELTEEQIQSAFDAENSSSQVGHDDEEIFTPSVTLWGFLSQVLHKEEQRSCLAAVARIGVMLVAMGRPRCAQNNGPYCRARGRLPIAVVEHLARDIATRCERRVPEDWLWHGRHVKLADGTTVTMADTEENQEAFPQQSCQQEGLGFPIARLVVLLSLATGMIHGMAMGRFEGKQTGELALFRELIDQLDPDDIVLVDKLFCTYFMIALLLERNVDMVVRLAMPLLDRQTKNALMQGELESIASQKVGHRPGRVEPRAVKRRPKPFRLLTMTRQAAQALLRQGMDPYKKQK